MVNIESLTFFQDIFPSPGKWNLTAEFGKEHATTTYSVKAYDNCFASIIPIVGTMDLVHPDIGGEYLSPGEKFHICQGRWVISEVGGDAEYDPKLGNNDTWLMVGYEEAEEVGAGKGHAVRTLHSNSARMAIHVHEHSVVMGG
jgi:hypothetical protein